MRFYTVDVDGSVVACTKTLGEAHAQGKSHARGKYWVDGGRYVIDWQDVRIDAETVRLLLAGAGGYAQDSGQSYDSEGLADE